MTLLPLSPYDRLLGRTAFAPRPRRFVEDEEDLLRQVGPPEVSGLGKLANFIDLATGASSVRDVLALKNPVDQFLHPLSHRERGQSISFRDLMTQYGARPNRPTGIRGWRDPNELALDLLGFAGEVATDPFTWTPPGLVAKAAKGAASAAHATRPVAAATRLLAPIANPIIDRTLATFSRSAMGQLGNESRAIAKAVTQGRDRAGVMAREAFAPELEQLGKFTAGMNQDDAIRSWVTLNKAIEGTDVLPPQMAHLQGVSDSIRAKMDALPAVAEAGGVKAPILDDVYAQYSGRRRVYAPTDEPMRRGAGGRGISGRHEAQIKREEFLKNVFGGTGKIQDLSVDPRFSGLADRIQPSQLTEKFWNQQAKQLNQVLTAGGAPQEFEHAKELAKWLGNLSEWHVNNKIPAFISDPIETATRRAEAVQSAVEMNKVARETIAPILRQAGNDLPGDVAVKELFEKTGFDVEKSLGLLSKDIGQAADKMYVPKEVADRILNVSKVYRNPDQVADLIFKPLKQYTQLWKNWVTSMPAFHTRNFTSGQIFNWMNKQFSGRSVAGTWNLLHGRPVTNMPWEKMGPEFRGLSNEEATRLFARQSFADNVAPRGQGVVAEGTEATLSRNLANDIPGVSPLTLRSILSRGRTGSLNPLDTEKFGLFKASRASGELTEGLNRISPYMELRATGVSRAEAAARVRSAQIDYADLSEIERKYVRHLIPFYGFSKGIAKKVASELIDKPGGRLAQTIRAQHEATAQELPLPSYVGQAGAIPLGNLDDGTKRYLTSLGLMHEDPLAFLGGGLKNKLAEVGSRLNPLLKLPIELMTGESLFQRGPLGGRELSEADPTLGRLLTNLGLREEPRGGRARPVLSTEFEHFMANMPTNRILTTLRTLTDPRKAAGKTRLPGLAALGPVLSGLRITDVSIPSQDRAIAQRANQIALEELGGRALPLVYVSKEDVAETLAKDPAKAARMDAYRRLRNYLDRKRRDRKKLEDRAQAQ